MATYKGLDYARWAAQTFDWTHLKPPRLEYVNANTLFSDFPAQRTLKEDVAAGMAEVFMPACADGARIAAVPDGRRFMVDGQHRRRAAQLAGAAGFWALVYELPSYEQACAMFWIVNGDGVVRTTPKAALNAAKESKRPREVHLWDILEGFNLCLMPIEGYQWFQSARIAASIYDVDDGDLLALVIEIITDCWGYEYYKIDGKRNKIPVLSDPVLEGMALFLAHHPQMGSNPALVREVKKSLSKRDLGDLMGRAVATWIETDHKPKLAFHAEREIVATFNHGRNATTGNRLSDRTARELMKLGDLTRLRQIAQAPDSDAATQEGA